MPTFCRHNRFIERCPICSKTLPEHAGAGTAPARTKRAAGGVRSAGASRRAPRAEGVRVMREGRAADDGFHSGLVPGIRSSQDAARLARELAFSSGRLLALAADPPGLYGEARALAQSDLEGAAWLCFLIVYLSPLEREDPFAGIREALAGGARSLTSRPPRSARAPRTRYRARQRDARRLPAVGPPGRRPGPGGRGQPAALPAFSGEPSWSPERRFERVFERLALPGFGSVWPL